MFSCFETVYFCPASQTSSIIPRTFTPTARLASVSTMQASTNSTGCLSWLYKSRKLGWPPQWWMGWVRWLGISSWSFCEDSALHLHLFPLPHHGRQDQTGSGWATSPKSHSSPAKSSQGDTEREGVSDACSGERCPAVTTAALPPHAATPPPLPATVPSSSRL